MAAPRITLSGTGAVSAAGWGVAPLMAAMDRRVPLPLDSIPRPGGPLQTSLKVRRVPEPANRPSFLGHPRLRRSSPISRFAAAAALEAIGSRQVPARRTGIIFTVLNGCVNYSARFFGEVLREPATASPILFPETVFNAPASHLATLMGFSGPAFTLIGDSAQFVPGVELAVQWLLDDEVDACLVVGAEEADSLTAEAIHWLSPKAVLSEGAGALLLERDGPGPLIAEVAGPVPISGPPGRAARTAAARILRESLAPLPPDALLIDDRNGCPRSDAPTQATWQDWNGPRFSPRRILGEAPGASTALQCVVAAQAVLTTGCPAALAVANGAGQQAAALILKPPC